MKKKKGFTLVELLAVIVILAVILIIAVPRITDVINNSKKASFESSAKTIASQAEKKYMENEVLGNSSAINCSDIANINSTDYSSCTITFDDKGNALVSIIGSGKFDGLVINNATKNSATTTELIVTDSKYFSYEDVEGGISITDYNIGYNVDVTVKDQSKCESYLTSDDQGFLQEEATTLCTGGDLDGFTLKDAVLQGNILSSDYEMAGIEVKWLDTYVDGGGEDVVIPSEIDGKKVVAISANAFENKGIKSVVIPDGVTSIGDYAFSYSHLTSVNIPSSVTSIGDYAFRNNQITSVNIPSSVTTIGDTAFRNNQITSVNIPSSVTTIGAFAFESNQLTSIEIPESVTSIGKSAFEISCSTVSCVNSVCTCTKVGGNANLSKIVNKTGKAFDWDLIINSSGKGRYTFITGDVVSDNKENHIVSIVSK